MAVGVAVAYVEDVLDLTTQPSEFAANRSRSLLSDSLLVPSITQLPKNLTLFP